MVAAVLVPVRGHQEVCPAASSRSLPESAVCLPAPVCRVEPLDLSAVLPLGPILRDRRSILGGEPTRRNRGLASDRRTYEPEVPAGDVGSPEDACGRAVFAVRLSGNLVGCEEGFLLMAVSYRDDQRIAVEVRA